MKKEAAEVITQYGGEIYEDYSGRGMFGSKTDAVTFDSEREFMNAIAEVMVSDDEDERELVAEAIRNIRSDSLGLGVIYY